MEYDLGVNAIFDTLKCPACGNKDFTEKHMVKDTNSAYAYVCQNCGYIMVFERELKNK